MLKRFVAFLAPVLLILGGSPAWVQADDERPRLHPGPRGAGKITIDGHLDEPAWAETPVGTGFVERIPVPKAKPPVETEVRVLYDDRALYVGVTMELLPGERPRGHELVRDSYRIWDDDAVTIKFDVHHDRRTTVGFGVNVAGAQIDFISFENGGGFRREFDAVWESATSVADTHWIAELRIPVVALGMRPLDGDEIIGFDVSRDHNIRVATDDWAHLPPEFGAASALHYGELHGIRTKAGGTPLSLIPYTLVGWPSPEGARLPIRLKVGGDIRLRIGNDTWTELTVLTDFAQVDLDDQVVNLSRFPLFLPEKRPFFLSGLDVFELGAAGTSQLFFTRRIGLDPAGNEVPILAGLKAYGRVGPVAFGVLNVLTLPTPGYFGANWLVGRLRRDLDEGSYVGAFVGLRDNVAFPFTDLDDVGFQVSPHYSVGIDGAARLRGRLELAAFGATTTTLDPGDSTESSISGLSGQATLRWRGERFRPSVSVLTVGEDFRPELGFVSRPGVLRISGSLPWVERTALLGLSSVTATLSAGLILSDDTERYLGASVSASVAWGWRTGWWLVVQGDYWEDVVEEDFDLFEAVAVPAGRYRTGELGISLDTPSRRNPSGGITYDWTGGFFGGDAHTVSAYGSVSLGRHLRFTASGTASRVDLPGFDSITTVAANAAVSVAPTTFVAIDLIGQLNNVADEVVTLARVRWRFLPGSDLFLVYREEIGTTPLESLGRSITLKVSYRFDTAVLLRRRRAPPETGPIALPSRASRATPPSRPSPR